MFCGLGAGIFVCAYLEWPYIVYIYIYIFYPHNHHHHQIHPSLSTPNTLSLAHPNSFRLYIVWSLHGTLGSEEEIPPNLHTTNRLLGGTLLGRSHEEWSPPHTGSHINSVHCSALRHGERGVVEAEVLLPVHEDAVHRTVGFQLFQRQLLRIIFGLHAMTVAGQTALVHLPKAWVGWRGGGRGGGGGWTLYTVAPREMTYCTDGSTAVGARVVTCRSSSEGHLG